MIARTEASGVLWCDGRRTVDLPPGARIEVRRGARPVRLVRLHEAPFTDRLVAKFGLPVEGWRGRRRAPRGRGDDRCLRSSGSPALGVIDVRDPRARARAHRDHRRDRRRQDDGRHRARAAARRPGRQRGRARRAAARPASRALVRVDDAARRRRRGRRRPAARSRTTACCWPATSRPRAAPAPSSAAPSVPGLAARRAWPSRWSPCTASPTSTGCCSRARSATRSTPSAAPTLAALLGRLPRAPRRARSATERELAEVVGHARASGPGRPTCCASGSARSRRSRPQPGEDAALADEEHAARARRHAAHRGRVRPARRCPSDEGGPDALAAVAAARTLLDGVRDHDPAAGELADRLAEITYLLSDLAADVASYAAGLETDPARLAAVSERRAALTALTRKYGETVDEVLAWAETSAARLLDLDDTDDRIDRAAGASATTLRGRARPAAARRCPRPAPRRPPRLGRRGHRRARPAGDAARACSRSPSRQTRARDDGLRGRRTARCGSGPSGVDEVELLLAANTGVRAAPARTRAPPAASCPG